MSTPDNPSRFPTWVPFALSLAVAVASPMVQWGGLRSDLVHLDRRVGQVEQDNRSEAARREQGDSKLESRQDRLESRQQEADRTLTRLEALMSQVARDIAEVKDSLRRRK